MKKKYINLTFELKEFIRSRRMSDGERLLPEKKLAEMFRVNHITLRKSLAVLESEGLIYKIASKGSFIGKAPRKTTKSNLIGLLIPEKDPFFFDVLIALEKHLALFNCALVLQVSQRSPARESEALKYFVDQGVDGIIAVPNRDCAELYRQLKTPIVFFDNMIGGVNIPYVLNDDFQAAGKVIEYLLSMGHRRIAYIGGQGDHSSTQRCRGYLETLKKHNIPIRNEYIHSREYSREWGYSAGEKLLTLPETPSAIFCGNDSIASGLLRYLMIRGIKCPGKISVIGCCNAPFSEDIGLSTIDQDTDSLAKMLWQTLQSSINGMPTTPVVLMPSRLVIRRTTGVLQKI